MQYIEKLFKCKYLCSVDSIVTQLFTNISKVKVNIENNFT